MAVYGVDTNVLVYWQMADLPEHAGVEAFFEREIYGDRNELGVAPLVLYEFVHVVTDARRFEAPLTVASALAKAEQIWRAREVRQLLETEWVFPTVVDLMRAHGLGRKRVLDTVLAAILRAHEVRTLLTANERDFASFPFLEARNPLSPAAR